MAAVHISYLITHNFLIRPPNFIKFISKCLVLKALEFEVHINLGYQNTLNIVYVYCLVDTYSMKERERQRMKMYIFSLSFFFQMPFFQSHF